MFQHTLVAFDRPLAGAVIRGQATARYDEMQLAAAKAEAFRQGQDAAQRFANQQLVELRTEVQALQDGLFQRLTTAEKTMLGELRGALPTLALEIARRLLAGYEPPPEVVERVCTETLDELYPERTGLELVVCTRDAAILEKLSPAWMQRYPGLRITIDPQLAPGDCLVRSRFGVTDARASAKLDALAHELRA